jgi:hypothetical protein
LESWYCVCPGRAGRRCGVGGRSRGRAVFSILKASTLRSNPRSALTVLGVLGGLVLFAVVGALVLGPGSTEIDVFPGVTLGDPPDLGTSGSSQATVIAKNTSGGFSLFGLALSRRTYGVRVQFYAPPDCWSRVDFGDRWPAPFDECSSDIAVEGEVAGLGRASSGHLIVAVDVEVAQKCFDAVSAGDSWPTDASGCIDDLDLTDYREDRSRTSSPTGNPTGSRRHRIDRRRPRRRATEPGRIRFPSVRGLLVVLRPHRPPNTGDRWPSRGLGTSNRHLESGVNAGTTETTGFLPPFAPAPPR